MMQILRGYDPGQIITVDPLPLRCPISRELDADVVIDASDEAPIEVVRNMTNGKGAHLVMHCVGGTPV